MDNWFAVLSMIQMIFKDAIDTDESLVLHTKFRDYLLRMSVAKDDWYRKVFFNLLFDMLVGTKLDGLIVTFRCTMIRVTERAIELTFDHMLLAFTLHHLCFEAVTACSFLTAYQINRLSIFKIEAMLAKGAAEVV
jgi:hypothetical protein